MMEMNLSAFSFSSSSSDEACRSPATAVGVDNDKNSQLAVKWAVDHLLLNATSIILIHVRIRQNPVNRRYPPLSCIKIDSVPVRSFKNDHNAENADFTIEPTTELGRDQVEAEITQLFLPYRGFCARKGIQLKEVVLEDYDVSQAIIDYITANQIHHIVVGASNRNAITRKFRNPDVPTCLIKAAPEFCGVYVIHKGKPVTVRTAKGPAPVSCVPPRQLIGSDSLHNNYAVQFDESLRNPSTKGNSRVPSPISPSPLGDRTLEKSSDYTRVPPKDRLLSTARTAPTEASVPDVVESPLRFRRTSLGDNDFHGCADFQFMDSGNSLEFEFPSETNSPVAGRDLEAELRMLKIELKQTMEMYNKACREALTAKQKARELHQWKLQEIKKMEELKRSEEAALALVEVEKAKCRAAVEAADAAKRIAEKEARKRLSAELRAQKEAEEKRKQLDAMSNSDRRYRRYSIDEIEIATSHFSPAFKIGEGGYGPVFRASLDHTAVAIKVLRPDAQQGRKQFHQEIEVLSCIRHPNMVLLLGACPEYGCLVYEYMDYGSLEDRLLRRGGTSPIPWPMRFKIAAEIAAALLFLHQTKPEPLVHRDLKPANVLLDRNYVSKISDVGLARLVPPSVAENVTQYRMTATAGTLCYIDPEYQQTGMLGVKSDIYSLGILLLQIITAKSPMGLSHLVDRAIEKGAFAEMLDPSVTDWPVDEALAFATLALKCAELRRKDRPDLRKVILPELNRLRSFGLEHKAARHDHVHAQHVAAPFSLPHQKQEREQEEVSENISAPSAWAYSIDDRGASEC